MLKRNLSAWPAERGALDSSLVAARPPVEPELRLRPQAFLTESARDELAERLRHAAIKTKTALLEKMQLAERAMDEGRLLRRQIFGRKALQALLRMGHKALERFDRELIGDGPSKLKRLILLFETLIEKIVRCLLPAGAPAVAGAETPALLLNN